MSILKMLVKKIFSYATFVHFNNGITKLRSNTANFFFFFCNEMHLTWIKNGIIWQQKIVTLYTH